MGNDGSSFIDNLNEMIELMYFNKLMMKTLMLEINQILKLIVLNERNMDKNTIKIMQENCVFRLQHFLRTNLLNSQQVICPMCSWFKPIQIRINRDPIQFTPSLLMSSMSVTLLGSHSLRSPLTQTPMRLLPAVLVKRPCPCYLPFPE